MTVPTTVAETDTTATISDVGRSEPATPAPVEEPVDSLVIDELLVEEISIDGMCGVY